MRPNEKGALASLPLILLCLSISAQIRLFEGISSPTLMWESQIGFYIPFAAFALVGGYHYLAWARKHRFQAVILMAIIIGAASLMSIATSNIQLGQTGVSSTQTLTTQSASQAAGAPSSTMPRSLQRLGEGISKMPYASTTFVAVEIGMSAVALTIILLRRRQRRMGPSYVGGTAGKIQVPHSKTLRTPRDVIVNEYLETVIFIKSKGMQIPDSDTPQDVLRRVSKTRPDLNQFQFLTLLYEEAKFSLHQVSAGYAESAAHAAVSIRNCYLPAKC